MRADIAVEWLSNTILGTKPYPNSYSIMLGVMGTFLIHPNLAKFQNSLVRDVIKEYGDERADSLVESMLRGEDGTRVVTMNEKEFYVLYKSLNNRHWSASIVCPESDIFGSNRRLFFYMIGVTVVGIMLILCFCMIFVSKNMKPLNMLAESAQRIAEGDFSEPIPSTTQADEVGILQNSFGAMQTALSKHIDRIQMLSENLQRRNEELNIIHQQTEEENQMKMSLIHKIADKMVAPAKSIDAIMSNLRSHYESITPEQLKPMSEQVLTQTKSMTDLLDRMLRTPRKKPTTTSNKKTEATS
jgi:methyl-accepting chemotaxis protein